MIDPRNYNPGLALWAVEPTNEPGFYELRECASESDLTTIQGRRAGTLVARIIIQPLFADTPIPGLIENAPALWRTLRESCRNLLPGDTEHVERFCTAAALLRASAGHAPFDSPADNPDDEIIRHRMRVISADESEVRP